MASTPVLQPYHRLSSLCYSWVNLFLLKLDRLYVCSVVGEYRLFPDLNIPRSIKTFQPIGHPNNLHQALEIVLRLLRCIPMQAQFYCKERTAFRVTTLKGQGVTGLGELWYDCRKRNLLYFRVTSCNPTTCSLPLECDYLSTFQVWVCLMSWDSDWGGTGSSTGMSVFVPAWSFSEDHLGSRRGGSAFSLAVSRAGRTAFWTVSRTQTQPECPTIGD